MTNRPDSFPEPRFWREFLRLLGVALFAMVCAVALGVAIGTYVFMFGWHR